MKSILLISAFFLLMLTGCNQKQVESLQTQLDGANKKIEEGETKIAALEAAWKKFEQGFDAEKRTQLDTSIAALEEMIQRAEKDVQQASSVLKDVQDLELDVKKLRDLCVKHESESSDANLVGKVRDTVDALTMKVQSVEAKAQDLASLRGKVQSLEGNVRSVEGDVRSMKFKVR